MSELTNLTDRLSHLRDRKGGSPVVQGGGPESQPEMSGSWRITERRFATEYLTIFVYFLLGIALASQIALIASLEII